jgi:CBS domain-containing protein
MQVAEILRAKGRSVETISGRASLSEAAVRMANRRIGCLVVSDDGSTVEGLITERDIVRAVAQRGGDPMRLATASVMSRPAPVCTPTTDVVSLMRTMTERRYRHVPVLDNGALVGIVSIGDVVKQRLDDLELEAMVLRDGFRSRH